MQMNDQREIQSDPATVFSALLDPDTLKICVPGAQEVTGNPADGYEAVVVQKVGPVKATFKGQVTMSDLVENQKMTILGEGKGGAAGFAKGGAEVTFSRNDQGGTTLTYQVEAHVGGKLAQLGSRLIDGFAKKMADQFFTNLQLHLEGPPEAEPATDAEPAKKTGWLKKLTR